VTGPRNLRQGPEPKVPYACSQRSGTTQHGVWKSVRDPAVPTKTVAPSDPPEYKGCTIQTVDGYAHGATAGGRCGRASDVESRKGTRRGGESIPELLHPGHQTGSVVRVAYLGSAC